MAPEVKPHAYRTFVSGLAKTQVERYDGGIVEEDNLGYFFHDRGCCVEDVRLMVDPSTSRCRGFGFVDFADQESYQKALTLAGIEAPDTVKLDASARGLMKIEAAKPAQPVMQDKQQELAKARDKTEDMERSLRLREARVRDLDRELRVARERQAQLDAQSATEKLLAEEQARQDEIRKAEVTLQCVEENLLSRLKGEQDRTRALEAIAHSVDAEQRGCSPEPESAPGAPAVSSLERSDSSSSNGPGLELRIKNTFYEFCIPKDTEPLVRTKTAPSVVHRQSSPTSSNGGYVQEAEPSPVLAPSPMASPPAPWALKRDTSNILRSILEDKMDAEAGSNGDARGRSASRAKASAEAQEGQAAEAGGEDAADKGQAAGAWNRSRDHITSWADESESLTAGDDDTDGRREVRIRNLPLRPAPELEGQLREELKRLWRVALGCSAPPIERIQVADHVDEAVATYAARAAGTEATVIFERAKDASWLVDMRQPANWTSAETLSLRGRVLHAEWPPMPPPIDWRKLRYKADTDASSQISYETTGTKRSFSGVVEARRAGYQTEGGARGAQPAVNRTVILMGISPELPVHTVRSEVLALLRRLWQRDGYRFDPEAQLHRGAEGGLTVRGARRPGQENDGTCVLRLRNYADAKWLVEQAKGLNIGGSKVSAMWARPKGSGS